MREYRDKIVQEVSACACDRCGRHMTPTDHEWYEKLSIAWRGGFESIFGDGAHVSLDLCQHCVRDTLGQWLRIVDSDDWAAAPGNSVQALKGIVRQPDAPVSVDQMSPAAWELRGHEKDEGEQR
ncbi:hypothetical protein [Burkholderia pseudomallei]|uniref:hypothetical protein n=1 Tax=Burkholderia pseudomallei TaxID=28450 RepID=UPI0015C3B96F|nr:hypothetical protein [Burkholderia pseudomallei]